MNRPRPSLLVVLFALTSALVPPFSSPAASSSTVVGATVPSATTLVTTGCAAGTSNVTEFGTVLPGSPARTSADCVVAFGSSNDTSTLRMSQADGAGTAMQRWTSAAMSVGVAAAFADVWSADRQRAWVVGTGGTIFQTTDGGASWAPQTSGVGSALNGVTGASATQLWAVGNNGVIRTSTNGGATWTGQVSGTTIDLNDVTAIDAQNLIAAGGDTGGVRVVLRTTNGGANWTDVSTGTMDNQDSITMVSSTVGWTVGQSPDIHRTTDGGATWTPAARCTGNQMRGVAGVSTSIAVAVGHLGTICRTTNGGASWTSVTSGTTQNLWDVSVAPDGTLWTVGRSVPGSVVLRSLDTGITWTQVATAAENLEAIEAFDRETAWWVGWNSLAARIPSGSLPDYDDAGGIDWAGTSSMFGVCASSVMNASTVWPVSAGCPMSDGTTWRAVPATTSDPLSRVATTTLGVNSGEARFRFGFRPSTSQAPGRYVASLSFEVVAPGT